MPVLAVMGQTLHRAVAPEICFKIYNPFDRSQ